MIETLDELWASPELEIFQSPEADGSVIGEIVAARRKEREEEIARLRVEADRVAEEARAAISRGPCDNCRSSMDSANEQNENA